VVNEKAWAKLVVVLLLLLLLQLKRVLTLPRG
jgi:hypothetical protein